MFKALILYHEPKKSIQLFTGKIVIDKWVKIIYVLIYKYLLKILQNSYNNAVLIFIKNILWPINKSFSLKRVFHQAATCKQKLIKIYFIKMYTLF